LYSSPADDRLGKVLVWYHGLVGNPGFRSMEPPMPEPEPTPTNYPPVIEEEADDVAD
jgi:hypothetical protein